jgi:peptide/nickel transport system substrate-binding protein
MAEPSRFDDATRDPVAKQPRDSGEARLTRRRLLGVGVASGLTIASGSSVGAALASSRRRTSLGASSRVLQIAHAGFFPSDTLETLKEINDIEIIVGGMLNEGLVGISYDWTPTPLLASSWEHNRNFTHWRFHIREGVKFHNGKPLTARDAAWTLARNLDKKKGSAIYGRLSASLDPAGILVKDAHTLDLQLKRPDSLITVPLANYAAAVAPAETTEFSLGIGTGPFRLKSWVAGDHFELERNPFYWQKGKPYLAGVRGIHIPETSTRIESVLSGASDAAEIDLSSVVTVRGNPKGRLAIGRASQSVSVVMDPTHHPFNDSRVITAMKYAVNRQRVIAVGLNGYGELAADTTAPSIDRLFPAVLRHQEVQDKGKAATLLKDAGYGSGIDLTLLVDTEPLFSNFALGFADGLAGTGFNVTVQHHSTDTYWQQIWLHGLFYVSGWQRVHPLEAMSIQLASNSTLNETKFHSKQLDGLMTEALRTSGMAQRKAIQDALVLVAKKSAQVVPAYHDRVWLTKPNVHGLTFLPETEVGFTNTQKV